ncbi:Alpha/Beta hydrolase protein [Crucibulum laeve]|uniref:Alpha/Beta hydrolase protein n=1 Tax=Crucibulum laeve TaxID=68775 RepID=A0A5C3MAD1_9AGAR|nr:Alpha/Beta hydrolase protein [Crucibulum laeve]
MASISFASYSSYYKGVLQFVDSWLYGPFFKHWSSPPPVLPSPSVTAPAEMATGYSTLMLPDGAKLAYEVLGSYYLGSAEPIVLICGMTSIRTDYERLTRALIKTRPVLIYDHRGMGNSSLTPSGEEDMTIELLARDLLFLLAHLKWKEVSLCGYSMGGVITQQLLLLPHHPTAPTSLPFTVTHILLAGTRSVVQPSAGLKLPVSAANKPRTLAERRENARRIVASLLDPRWVEENGQRFEYLFNRATNNLTQRPTEVITRQGSALQKFKFDDLLHNFPRDVQIMVIHGHLDQVIPYHCGEDILKRIPWAQRPETGNQPGQIPSFDFGHYWYEYFDVQVWHHVVDQFLGKRSVCIREYN